MLRGCTTALALALVCTGCVEPVADAPAAMARESVAEALAPQVAAAPIPAYLTAEAPRAGRIRLVAAGDIAFGRYHMDKRYRRIGGRAPFAGVDELIAGADLALANLETPLAAEPERLRLTRSRAARPGDPGWSLSFRAEPADAALLAAAGFTHLSLANNHILDMGHQAAVETVEHLGAAGVVGLGCGLTPEAASRPAVIEAGGVRVAVAAWTVWNKGRPAGGDGWAVAYLGNRDLRTDLAGEIARIKADLGADFVVLSLHWGWEYEDQPRDSQRQAARALIDAGADVILGHHPHVVQPFERYRRGVIAYSLGNFLFDQTYRPARRSALLEVVLDAGERAVVEARLYPLQIAGGDNRPRRSGSRRWARTLQRMAPGFEVVGGR